MENITTELFRTYTKEYHTYDIEDHINEQKFLISQNLSEIYQQLKEYSEDILDDLIEQREQSNLLSESEEKQIQIIHESLQIPIEINQTIARNIDNIAISEKSISDSLLTNQILSIEERNLDSAITSMENAFIECDKLITKSIETSAQSVEDLIPTYRDQLMKKKLEFISAHESTELLEKTVYANYSALRSGYITSIKNVFHEGQLQNMALTQLERHSYAWQRNKMEQVLDYYNKDEVVLNRKEYLSKVNSIMDQTYNKLFERLQLEEHLAFKQQYLLDIGMVENAIMNWKFYTMQEMERWYHEIFDDMERQYIELVEQFQQILMDLQHDHTTFAIYSQQLTHLSHLNEHTNRQYHRQLYPLLLEDRWRSSLLMGTRLRNMCRLCDSHEEDTLDCLWQLLVK